jgi:hypothetical protein
MFDNTANANEAAAGAATVTDTITVLTCKPGKFLAKRIQPDGADINYDKAKFFDIEERLFHDVAELGALLQEIARDPRRCIVLAELIDKSRCRHVRRLGKAKENYPPTLKRVPRRYVGIDFDNLPMPEGVAHEDLEACARAAIAHLPPEFHGAAGWVQATSGHGRKPEMRLRLWYCLSRPVWEAEFKLWLGVVPGTDGSVYGGIQPIFVANPAFENGAVDHLPRRWLMLPGADAVTVPDEFPMPQRMAGGRTYETPFNGPPVPTTEAAAEELRAACAAIEAAMPGNRHATARDATWRLAQLIKGGLLDHAEAEAALCAALVAAGKADGAQELRDLLTSALARAPAAEPWIAAEDEFDAEPLDEDEDEPEATDEPEDREPPGREDDMEDISEEGAAAAGGR